MKNKTLPPVTLKASPGAVPMDWETARRFFTESEIAAGERRFEMTHFGPWNVLRTCRGLAVTAKWEENPAFPGERRYVESYTLHGDRSLSRAMESGYALEGEVSIEGKRSRAFTSSILFRLPDGRLFNCAILHVCTGQKFSRRG